MNLWRTIVEEASFTEKFEYLINIHPRLDDVKEGVDFLLARDPTVGEQVYPNFYVINTNRLWNIPSFSILYRYEDNPEEDDKVYLISITIHTDTDDYEWDW
jgi:hypothetical protein